MCVSARVRVCFFGSKPKSVGATAIRIAQMYAVGNCKLCTPQRHTGVAVRSSECDSFH